MLWEAEVDTGGGGGGMGSQRKTDQEDPEDTPELDSNPSVETAVVLSIHSTAFFWGGGGGFIHTTNQITVISRLSFFCTTVFKQLKRKTPSFSHDFYVFFNNKLIQSIKTTEFGLFSFFLGQTFYQTLFLRYRQFFWIWSYLRTGLNDLSSVRITVLALIPFFPCIRPGKQRPDCF